MLSRIAGWDDTVVALATPQGIGALGVVRLSGKRALDIVNQVFPSKDLHLQPSHSIHVGFIVDNTSVIDQVVVSLYKAPSSYTGENVVEISAHGSPYIHQRIINAAVANGARIAKPGEFTLRAFLNGKLDLVQAEAVADLIASNTEASRATAINNIRGGFSAILSKIREQLLTFSALVELELDFSQEDVEFADRSKLMELIATAKELTGRLIVSFDLGNVVKNGVQVAIIGKPNAGKSTLLNSLLNESRAIVSDIPGTTRDTIEEELNIGGIIFRLIDTAGLRNETIDVIERIGVEKSMEKMMRADVVIYLFDVNELGAEELNNAIVDLRLKEKKFLVVGNKIDLANGSELDAKFRDVDVLYISAFDNSAVESLKSKLVNVVLGGSINVENIVITNARHFEALKHVNKSLDEIEAGIRNQITGDLLSLDIRTCLHYLGEITGEITNEDQLDYIFSKFCIGK